MANAGLSPNDPNFDISNELDVSALLRAEERHFWHRARNRFLLERLARLGLTRGARVLDLGCGAGCVAAALAQGGYDVTGVDGHEALLAVARRRAPRATFLCHDLRAGAPELPHREFDVVALFDVLEHFDAPLEVLTRARAWVRPGGSLVGTVPALMSLWSGVDEHAGHKRRYTQPSLSALLGALEGGRVREVVSFFRPLVPLLWVQRAIVGRRGDARDAARNLAVPPAPANAGLYALCRAERYLAPLADRLKVPGASLWFAVTCP